MKNRSNQSILLAALICVAFPVLAGEAAKKAVVPVEPPEDIWVHPITGPYWHEDSFISTDLRPVFAYHHFPTEVFGGGRALVYAAQLRVKLLDRLQLVAYKDGYMDIQLKGYNEPGWNDIAAGLKYQFLANDDIKLYAAAGAAYEFASGDDEVLQDDDEVRMWASINKGFGKLHLGATFNYFLCTDNGDDPFTDSNHISWHFHADYEVCKWFSPVVEVNGYHVVAEGDVVTPFQGSDVLNLGGDASEDVVTVAVGAEIRPFRKFAIRAAYERAITDNTDLWGHRWTFSSVIEF